MQLFPGENFVTIFNGKVDAIFQVLKFKDYPLRPLLFARALIQVILTRHFFLEQLQE